MHVSIVHHHIDMHHYCGQLAIQHLTVGHCMELITTPRAFPAACHVQNIKCYVKKMLNTTNYVTSAFILTWLLNCHSPGGFKQRCICNSHTFAHFPFYTHNMGFLQLVSIISAKQSQSLILLLKPLFFGLGYERK